MSEVKSRLLAFIEYKKISVRAFEKEIGAANGYVSKIVQSISPSKIERIANFFPDINVGWLLTGEGEMLKEKTAQAGNARMVDVSGMQIMQVPVVPVHAQAGFLSGYGDTEYIDSLPTMAIPVDTNYQGKYFVFVVSGDSMDDGSSNCLLDGDKVLVRELPVDYWKFKLHARKWNFWVFVTRTEGVVIKKIKEQNLDTGEITLTSLNPLYKDIHLHINDVAGIYNVVRLVERNF